MDAPMVTFGADDPPITSGLVLKQTRGEHSYILIHFRAMTFSEMGDMVVVKLKHTVFQLSYVITTLHEFNNALVCQ